MAALSGSLEQVQLGERERRAFSRAFGVWRFFVQSPRTRANDLSVQVARRQRQFMESWLQDLRLRIEALDAETTWQVEQHQGAEGGRLLVTAGGADAVVVYGLLEPAVRVVNEALSRVAAQDRALMEAHLPRTLIVPLVRDRSLRSEAIDLSTLVIGDESWTPQWWHFAPKPVPDELATAYPVWDDAELQLGNRLSDFIAASFATATHILDLPARRDLDDSGKAVLDDHLARIDPSPVALLDEALRQHDLLAAAVGAMGDSEPYRDDLVAALEEIRKVIDEAPRWASESEVPIEELRAWKPRIDEAVGMVAAVRVAGSTVVLARSRQ